jgi:serine/threonine protein phosphatase PrpC
MIRTVLHSQKGERSPNNEDAALVLSVQNIAVVADGVGGGPAGEEASRWALCSIERYLKSRDITENEILSAIKLANSSVREKAQSTHLQGMASTLVLAWVTANEVICFNVGDSRTYLLRQKKLVQLSNDHVAAVERQGRVKNFLTRAIGIADDPDTEITRSDWQKGDVLLLVSDGIYDKMPHEQLESICNQSQLSMYEKTSAMINLSLRNGGADDKTVIMVF